jgi:hypothetical protein
MRSAADTSITKLAVLLSAPWSVGSVDLLPEFVKDDTRKSADVLHGDGPDITVLVVQVPCGDGSQEEMLAVIGNVRVDDRLSVLDGHGDKGTLSGFPATLGDVFPKVHPVAARGIADRNAIDTGISGQEAHYAASFSISMEGKHRSRRKPGQ